MVVAISLVLSAAAQAQQADKKDDKAIVIEGSTTVGPIAEGFAAALMKIHPDTRITVNASGSGDGAAALIDGRAQVASMSRFMKVKEFKAAVDKGVTPVAHAVAMDGVAVVVHPSNPVGKLTTEQLRKIYAGEITNWKQLGGADRSIVVVSRDTNSGTYETFNEKVMGGKALVKSAEYVKSTAQAKASVQGTEGAIAYVGIGYLDDKVRAVAIDGVSVNRKTVANGSYPIARPLFLFTNGYPAPGTMLFTLVTFHLTEMGQEIIEAKGFVPLTNY
jgi:phosphate transport system substrate-binding protein